MTDSTNPNTPDDHRTRLPETWQGEVKALLVLGVPLALTQLVGFFVFTIDLLMIERLGPEAIAATSFGVVIYFTLYMLGFGPVMAVSPLVSQALGANRDERADARLSVRMCLWAIIAMLPLGILIFLNTERIALLLGQDPQIARASAAYVMALAPGWPFGLAIMALRNFLAAIDRTRVPVMLAIVTTGLNAFLNWVLIFGHLGAPPLGLVGAGIASSLSYIGTLGLYLGYCYLDDRAREFDILRDWLVPNWDRFREALRLAWPISVTTMFEGMLFNAAVPVMGLIGVMEMAGYQIALNVAAMAFMLPWGLSMAGSVRIGLAVGARNQDAAVRAAFVTIGTAIAAIMCFALPIAFAPEAIAALYLRVNDPENAAVIGWVVAFLPVAAGFMLFDAIQVAANQLLRGLKDVQMPMVLTGVSYWVIGFPVAIWLGLYSPIGAVGVWYGLMAGLAAASVTLGLRLWLVLRRGGVARLAVLDC